MYQHNMELTERFARENPDVINKAPGENDSLRHHVPVREFSYIFPRKVAGRDHPLPGVRGW
jgi:hypothetical protein